MKKFKETTRERQRFGKGSSQKIYLLR